MEHKQLSANEEKIFISLTSLDNGQRLTKQELKEHTKIPERMLYEDIRSMRRKKYLVAAFKGGNRGYCLAKNYGEAISAIKEMEAGAHDTLETARIMRQAAIEQFKKEQKI